MNKETFRGVATTVISGVETAGTAMVVGGLTALGASIPVMGLGTKHPKIAGLIALGAAAVMNAVVWDQSPLAEMIVDHSEKVSDNLTELVYYKD